MLRQRIQEAMRVTAERTQSLSISFIINEKGISEFLLR